jgi:hypothetical protein
VAVPLRVGQQTLFFSPDSKTGAGTTRTGLLVFDVATGRKLREFKAPDGAPIRGGAFSPDGRALALALGNDELSVWEVATGQERVRLVKARLPEQKPLMRVPPAVAVTGIALGDSGETTVAFSPDGRLLARAADRAVTVWDVRTGKEVRKLQGHQGTIGAIAFAPDGQALASGSADSTALVWDVSGLAGRGPTRALTPADLQAHWAALAGDDAVRGFAAVCALAEAPAQAAPYLKERLRPAAPVDPQQVRQLIKGLGSERFAERQKAAKELERLGDAAAELKKALADKVSLEVQQRIEGLLNQLARPDFSGERLRVLRAVEVLEAAGTPAARQVLETLAGGAPETLTTTAARAALARLRP